MVPLGELGLVTVATAGRLEVRGQGTLDCLRRHFGVFPKRCAVRAGKGDFWNEA
jgi:hypothetical protein